MTTKKYSLPIPGLRPARTPFNRLHIVETSDIEEARKFIRTTKLKEARGIYNKEAKTHVLWDAYICVHTAVENYKGVKREYMENEKCNVCYKEEYLDTWNEKHPDIPFKEAK